MPVNRVRRRGSYAPLSAHYYKDDALLRAGEKAEVLFLRGLAFCADVLSDGEISDAQLTYVGIGLSNVQARAQRLVEVGLWDRGDNGYYVRSWLAWNKSREDILGDTEKDRRRKSEQTAERPFPPEPPPDDQAEPDRNPNGVHADSERNPNGFQSPARGPARAHSRAAAAPGQSQGNSSSKSSSARAGESVDLVDQAVPPTTDPGTRKALERHVAEALDRAVEPDDIARGLATWVRRRCGPGLLPRLITDEIKNSAGATDRGAEPRASTTDAAVAAAQALKHTPTPNLRALPGGTR